MRHSELDLNIAGTLKQMYDQTGKRPGGPTGLCYKVVFGAMTGAQIDFTSPCLTKEGQTNEANEIGLHEYPLLTGLLPSGLVVVKALDQTVLGIDAVFIRGQSRRSPRRHIIAVAPDGGKGPYKIVDSMLPGASKTTHTLTDIPRYVEENFLGQEHDISVVPDRTERQARTGDRLDPICINEEIIVFAPTRGMRVFPREA